MRYLVFIFFIYVSAANKIWASDDFVYVKNSNGETLKGSNNDFPIKTFNLKVPSDPNQIPEDIIQAYRDEVIERSKHGGRVTWSSNFFVCKDGKLDKIQNYYKLSNGRQITLVEKNTSGLVNLVLNGVKDVAKTYLGEDRVSRAEIYPILVRKNDGQYVLTRPRNEKCPQAVYNSEGELSTKNPKCENYLFGDFVYPFNQFSKVAEKCCAQRGCEQKVNKEIDKIIAWYKDEKEINVSNPTLEASNQSSQRPKQIKPSVVRSSRIRPIRVNATKRPSWKDIPVRRSNSNESDIVE